MVFIPLRCDSPADHAPWGTFLVFGANMAVAILLGFAIRDRALDSWILRFGAFNPLTWITSAFIHADWVHLLGNMLFLWGFGLIVEGLIGWRFLLVYLALAAGQGAVEQILMLGADGGGSFGASGAISGLMAMAALWAPRNKMSVFVWVFPIRPRMVEMSVAGLAALFVGIDLLYAFAWGFGMSSELLHLMGAGIGVAIGVAMLKNESVDCGGWDYLSLRRDGPPSRLLGDLGTSALAAAHEPADPRVRTLVRVRDTLEAGEPLAADAAYVAGRRVAAGWVLPRSELLALIRALLDAGHVERALSRMEEFVTRYPEGSETMRLTLANHLLRTRRPTQALEVLGALADEVLTPAQRTSRAGLEASARAALRSGRLELEG